MNNMIRRSLILICVVLIYSCTTSKPELKKYKYEQDLKNYITATFSQPFDDFVEKKFFFIIPTNGCSPCVKEILQELNRNPNPDSLIILTDTNKDKEITNLSKRLAEFSNVLWDKQNEFIYYETNITSSTLLFLKNEHFFNQTLLQKGSWENLSKLNSF